MTLQIGSITVSSSIREPSRTRLMRGHGRDYVSSACTSARVCVRSIRYANRATFKVQERLSDVDRFVCRALSNTRSRKLATVSRTRVLCRVYYQSGARRGNLPRSIIPGPSEVSTEEFQLTERSGKFKNPSPFDLVHFEDELRYVVRHRSGTNFPGGSIELRSSKGKFPSTISLSLSLSLSLMHQRRRIGLE